MPKKKKSESTETPEFSEDKIIEVLDYLGYKKIKQGDSYFFLPKRSAIKFLKKLTKEKAYELFNKK